MIGTRLTRAGSPLTYNWQRPHDSLAGRAPIDRVCERLRKSPLWEDVESGYGPAREPIRTNDYAWDTKLNRAGFAGGSEP